MNGDSVIFTIDTDGQHDPADISRRVEQVVLDKATSLTAQSNKFNRKIT
ncbi:MAG: hypothetical protein PHW87_03905 [Methanothrix sp.]|nr:hypothetical protein [Methanothrix sp.]